MFILGGDDRRRISRGFCRPACVVVYGASPTISSSSGGSEPEERDGERTLGLRRFSRERSIRCKAARQASPATNEITGRRGVARFPRECEDGDK